VSFVSVATPKLDELVGEQISCGIVGGAVRRDRKLLAERELITSGGARRDVVSEAINGGRRGEHTQGRAVNNADRQRRIERPRMRRATIGVGQ
jgi:hypothetical protein